MKRTSVKKLSATQAKTEIMAYCIMSVIGIALIVYSASSFIPADRVLGISSSLTADTNLDTKDPTINPLATILCIGPDGREFRATYRDCATFNKAWDKKTFSYQQIPGVSLNRPTESLTITKTQSTPTTVADTSYGKEIESDDAKIQISFRDDEFHVKTTKIDGREVEMETGSMDHINEFLAPDDIQLQKDDVSGVRINQSGISMRTQLPVTVDINTHNLSVLTPSGEKTVTIMPARALQNMRDKRVITGIDASSSATLTTAKDDALLLTLPAVKEEKFGGLIPVTIHKILTISAETGEITAYRQPFIDRLLDWVSF